MSKLITGPHSEVSAGAALGETPESGGNAILVRDKRWARVRLLWDQRLFLGRMALAGLILSILLAFLLPAEYESTAQLMPPDQRSSTAASVLSLMSVVGPETTGNNANAMGGVASQLLGSKNTGDLFVGVLKSATLENRLIDRFDLRTVYHTRLYTKARKRLEENTATTQDRKSGIISLTVTDHDPKRAMGIGGAYISELNSLMSQLDNSSAHRQRLFLEGRLSQVKTELADAERAFSQYSSKSGAIDITEQGKSMVEAAALLQGQLMGAESQLEGLRQIYAPDNVRVRAAEAQVQELKQQLQKFNGMPGETPANQSANEPGNTSLYPTIRQLPLIGVTYADLLRQLKIKETVFEVLTKEHELAKAQEAGEAPSVNVLDLPSVPESRSYPPRVLIVCLGPIVGFALGIFLLLGREYWREIDPNKPGKLLANEILGSTSRRAGSQSAL